MKKYLFLMFFASLFFLSANANAQQQTFKFVSDMNGFHLLDDTEVIGNILISPSVADSELGKKNISKINIKTQYYINPDVEYTVTGYFKNLNIRHNSIVKLDVSGLKMLEGLSCSNNDLETLDVSNLTKLKKLECYSNKLTSLNIDGCNSLKEIRSYFNIFDSCTYDDIYLSLPNRLEGDDAKFYIRSTYSTNFEDEIKSRRYIAKAKNWKVLQTDGEEWWENKAEYACAKTASFTFKSEGSTFKFANFTEALGDITISPSVKHNGENLTKISKGNTYNIEPDTEYIVVGSFTKLGVSNNQLTSLDISGLAGLNEFKCGSNKLLDVKANATESVIFEGNNQSLKIPMTSDGEGGFISVNKYTLETDNQPEMQGNVVFEDGYFKCSVVPSEEMSFFTNIGLAEGNKIEGKLKFENTTAGVEKFNSVPQINAYPNPVVDELHIDSAELVTVVFIYDTSGKLLIKEKVNATNFVLPTAQLKTGMYILRLQFANTFKNIKIIKE